MKAYKSVPVRSSEITPEHVYLNRRKFMQAAGAFGASALLAACAPAPSTPEAPLADVEEEGISANGRTDELNDKLNSFEEITNYNNFYEFSFDKEMVAVMAKDYITSPWDVEVGGLVNNPKTFSMEDILAKFTQQERIYRMRCVEGWSMVIPWEGFPLSELLKEVEPTSNARYVAFQTALDYEQMPNLSVGFYPWPYTEGLRLDEAMNDLTLMVTGMYGKQLLPQNGAPLRLAVPWKYGFKSIKSIVKIDLVAEEPPTLWSAIAPYEYGFYANVNPDVPHPRWSQSSERRIGEINRRRTLMFNGYAEQVASMYEGMDLSKLY
jgi:methionine sulfoxide reductase catalytic subunit